MGEKNQAGITPQLSKITVVVPVHNAARTLKECLRALRDQSDHNYEVIIVDDHSSDNSLEICGEFGFKIITLTVNKGQSVARNKGVKASTGEIIAFVDSDAVVPPNWLGKYRYLLTLHKDADMVCSGYSDSAEGTEAELFALYETQYRRIGLPLYITSSTSSNCIIYKKAFGEAAGYPEYYINSRIDITNQRSVTTNEDAEFGFLLSQKGKKIVWSHNNPVRHYFRNSWKGYLSQQAGFARYAVLSIFKFPKKLFNKNIFSGERIILQIVIILVMLSALLGLLLGDRKIFAALSLLCLILLYAINRRFMNFLKSNMKNYAFPRLFFWLIVSRLCCLSGIILGLKDGCRMLWNNYCFRRLNLNDRRLGVKN